MARMLPSARRVRRVILTGRRYSRTRSLAGAAAVLGTLSALAAMGPTTGATAQTNVQNRASASAALPGGWPVAARGLFDYSYAGYRFGAVTLPEGAGQIIEATAHGVIADDNRDDSEALERAMVAARAVNGPVILRLPAGRLQISRILYIDRSDFILRGAGQGEGGTELYMQRPLRLANERTGNAELAAYLRREDKVQREPDQGINNLFSIYSWSGGFLHVGRSDARPASYDPALDRPAQSVTTIASGRRGDRTIDVVDAANFQAGQIIRLQWFARQGRDSGIIRSIYGDTDQDIGSHHWSNPNRAAVSQPTRIESIRGRTITIGDPLLHDANSGQPAEIAPWNPLVNVGIESLRIAFPYSPWFGHHLEDGWNGIYFTGAYDGWVRNLVIDNADSGILTDDAANLTIADIRTTGRHRAHYAVHVGATHNILVRDISVENPVIHPLSFNTRSTRSVYLRANVLVDGRMDQHSGSNHANLFDQVTLHIRPRRQEGIWRWQLWEGGGASYWRPGHGRGNTAWNLQLVVPDNVPADANVTVYSGMEGPGKTIVGLHGNRPLTLQYTPAPAAVIDLNSRPAVPSLYQAQLQARTGGGRR